MRKNVGDALGHSTVCVASLSAVAKMYAISKRTVVANICGIAEVYVRLQLTLLVLCACIFETVTIDLQEGGGALASFSIDHYKYDEARQYLVCALRVGHFYK